MGISLSPGISLSSTGEAALAISSCGTQAHPGSTLVPGDAPRAPPAQCVRSHSCVFAGRKTCAARSTNTPACCRNATASVAGSRGIDRGTRAAAVPYRITKPRLAKAGARPTRLPHGSIAAFHRVRLPGTGVPFADICTYFSSAAMSLPESSITRVVLRLQGRQCSISTRQRDVVSSVPTTRRIGSHLFPVEAWGRFQHPTRPAWVVHSPSRCQGWQRFARPFRSPPAKPRETAVWLLVKRRWSTRKPPRRPRQATRMQA